MVVNGPSTVALRVKLPRGLDGVEFGPSTSSAAGAVLVTSLSGRGKSDALLQLGDHIYGDASEVEQLMSQSKCELTLVREDASLVSSLKSHDMLEARDGSSVPCFRLLKLPLRHEADSCNNDGIEVNGLRVAGVSGVALADGLICVGDLIVALNGRRVDPSTIDQPTASPMRVFTVLRPCPEFDVPATALVHTVDDKRDALAAALESMDIAVMHAHTDNDVAIPVASVVEVSAAQLPVASPPPADAPLAPAAPSPPAPSPPAPPAPPPPPQQPLSQSMPAPSCQDTSEGLSPEEPPRAIGPSRRLHDARVATNGATEPAASAIPFEPLKLGGVWCDLPTGDGASPVYDPGEGVWSDLPSGSSSRPRRAQTVHTTKAALDTMIRQALQASDDALLRRLVAAQQALRPRSGPTIVSL